MHARWTQHAPRFPAGATRTSSRDAPSPGCIRAPCIRAPPNSSEARAPWRPAPLRFPSSASASSLLPRLSTPCILTFKSFQAHSEAPQTRPLLVAGFWNAENPGTLAVGGLAPAPGDGGSCVCAGPLGSAAWPPPLHAPTLCRRPPPPILAVPGPSLAASLGTPFVEEAHSCVPHCLVSSPLLGLCS